MSACRPRRGTRGGGTRAGGDAVAGTIAFRTARGIPVVGHVGLTPQAVNALGGYRARGRDEAEAAKILADAKAVAEAGCFALVLEGVMEEIAAEATRAVACPEVGVGGSAGGGRGGPGAGG